MTEYRSAARRRPMRIYVEPRDAWLGMYLSDAALYWCPLPGVVVRWSGDPRAFASWVAIMGIVLPALCLRWPWSGLAVAAYAGPALWMLALTWWWHRRYPNL